MFRSRLEQALNRVWYGGAEPGVVLRTLEKLYALGLNSRRRTEPPPVADLAGRPIVVVGNVTVGGTGKTPLIVRLCELLQGAGLSPGVVARGYGRHGRDLLLLDGTGDVRVTGDEPRLIHDRTQVPVAVCDERVEAARALFDRGVEVVLSDDGLQHRRLPRTYEICVVDGQRAFGNGHLLPAGPLREDRSRLDTVDAIVVNGSGDVARRLPGAVAMSLEPGQIVRLDGAVRMEVNEWRRAGPERPVIAVAGIGNPERFFRLLENLEIKHRPRAFPDHHDYTAQDFSGLGNERIVMTEKDAVKCRQLPLTDAWYLPVSARLPQAWEEAFLARVIADVREQGAGA